MNKGLLKALLAVLLVAGLAAGAFGAYTWLQRREIASLEREIAALQAESVPLRFMVVSREAGKVTVRVRLYDAAGAEAGFAESTLDGEQVFVDFLAVPFKGIWLAIPHRIFTERVAPVDGFDLSALALVDGVPKTYVGSSLGGSSLERLGAVFSAALAGEAPRGAFGNAVHDMAELGSFEAGLVYKVVVRIKGGIEVLEDDGAD